MYGLLERDRALLPYRKNIERQMERYYQLRDRLTGGGRLADFANAHEYYGFHHSLEGWVYREWAPAADAVYLMGDFNDWNETSHPLTRLEKGT